jgi:hypothetical protein
MKYLKGWTAYNESADSQKFQYMMLGRLQTDCDYFLGNGQRSVNNLWGETVEEHIAEMKKIWNELEVKPEWLTMEQIEDYERQMTEGNTESDSDDKYYVVWEEDGQEQSELIDTLEEAKDFYEQIKVEKFHYEKPKLYIMSYNNGELIQGEKWNIGDESSSTSPVDEEAFQAWWKDGGQAIAEREYSSELEQKFTDQSFVDSKVIEYYGESSVGDKDAENNAFWYAMEEMAKADNLHLK